MPVVSVLVVTYNSEHTIRDCLVSLDRQTFTDFEILLVDNHSQDRTRDVIESVRSGLSVPLQTFYVDVNLGFAAANNALYRQTQTPYLALLNPDAVADPCWLEALVTTQEKCPDVGMCASKLLRDDGMTIDSAGDGFSSVLKGYKRGEGRPRDRYAKEEYVFGACGGAALYRRAMLREIGFFDEVFFLIHEDTDLNLRAQLAGWRVRYVPDAVVYHKMHASIGKMSETQVYYSLRNVEFVRIKNLPLSMILKHLPAMVTATGLEFFYFAVKHRRLGTYLRAKTAVITHLPVLYQKRQAILRARPASTGTFEGVLTPAHDPEFMSSRLTRLLFG